MDDRNPAAGSPPGSRARGQVDLLRHNPRFRALWASRFVSFTGDSVSIVALLIYLAGGVSGPLAVALLMIVTDFLPSLLSPLAGAIADRIGLRRVMVTCDVLQAALVALIALTLPPLPILLVLVALRSITATIFQPASRAAVPALVKDRDLERANAAIGLSTSLPDFAGPVLAAVLFGVVGVRGLLLLDSLTFVLSALLLLRLPRLAPHPRDPRRPSSFLGDARLGLAYAWRNRVVRVISIGFVGVVFFNATDDVALVFLATDVLHADESGASLVYAGVGIGLLAGFMVMGRLALRVPTAALLVAGYAISSLGNLLTGLAWAVVVAFAFQAVRGIAISAMDVGHNTLIQRVVPGHLLGRVFGNVYGAVGAAAGASYLMGGMLLELTDARTTLIVAGAGGLLVTAIVSIGLPRALRHTRPAIDHDGTVAETSRS